MPSDDEMIFSPIDHLCRYCSHRLEAADVDPAWVRALTRPAKPRPMRALEMFATAADSTMTRRSISSA
jgi:hypothetical protein